MVRASLFLLLLVFTSPAYGQVEGCTYHQRSPGTVSGVPLVMEMWQKGCTTFTFLQYAAKASVKFDYSPCSPYNLKIWVSDKIPPGARYLSWYYQKSWGQWKQSNFQFKEHDFFFGRGRGSGVLGTTLWCGEWTQPVPFPKTAKQTTPQRSNLAAAPAQNPLQEATSKFGTYWLIGICSASFGIFLLTQWVRRKIAKQPPEQTKPPEQAQTTPPPQNAQQSADKEQIKPKPEEPPKPEPPKEKKPEGVVVGVAVDGEKPGGELILEPSLRIRHLYLIGKTRTGKTTLIKNLALQDMDAGFGLCFVDPHGDAAEDLIGSIPQHRIQDVIYFDPASETCPAFNILRTSFAPQKLTEDIVNVLKMFFGSSWGFRMEHILRYAILTLLHDPEPRTLKDLRALLINESYRAEIIANIEDEAIREFWELEFAEFSRSAVDPIVNKLSSFLVPGSPLLRLFSQKENALDFSRIMDEQKILIVNLSKGLLSEDPSRLLGGLIVTGIQQAALGRAEMSPEQRKDFHLYLDEFQNFVVESFESILSEAAKYKLFLTLAHQTLGQVPGYLKHGIFGNVATLIAFQISAEDAATVQREMHRPRYLCFSQGFSNWVSKEDYLAWATDILKRRIQKYANHAGEQRPYWFPDSFKERLERVLAKLTHPELTLEALRDIIRNTLEPEGIEDKPFFPRLETKELDYPSIDDFINQQPRHAFCRKERAENVTLFRTLPAPDPNPAVKAAVLRAMNTQATYSTKSSAVNPEEFIHAKKEAPRAEPQPAEQPTMPPEMPNGEPQAQEAAPKPEIDPVKAARERRAQKGAPKRSTPKRTPAPQNEDDFSF